AFGRSNPQPAIPRSAQRRHGREQLLKAGRIFEMLAAADKQSSAPTTGPEIAADVLRQRPDIRVAQSSAKRIVRPVTVLKTIQPATLRACPQGRVAIETHRKHRPSLPRVRWYRRFYIALANHGHAPAACAHPDVAFAVLLRIHDPIGREAGVA